MKKFIMALMISQLFCSPILAEQKFEPNWESLDSRPIPAWFEDAKFGIFVHWGLYSVPAWGPTEDVGVYEKYAEWYWYSLMTPSRESHGQFNRIHKDFFGDGAPYQQFVEGFRCEMFEPKDWADIFRNSGARYVVLTSKHHEGFALWPSEHSWNWNAGDVGPTRDLAGELNDAVRDSGLRMGFYYSLYEWFNPLYHDDVDAYVENHMLPQMYDLVNRYEPDVVWADGEWDYGHEVWRSTEFLSWLYNESPVKDKVVVNDRWGKQTRGKHGDFYTTEYDLVHAEDAAGLSIDHPWEECRGIGTSFGYNRNEDLSNYSSSEELVHILIDKVSRGGNLLLNVGPTADGRIPVIMQQRLQDIGDWMAVNGEAIYGTRKWKGAPKVTAETKTYFTAKGKDLYVLSTEFPAEPLKIEGVNPVGKVSLLGSDFEVDFSQSGKAIRIDVPAITPANNPGDHAWVFKLEGAL